MTMVFVGALNSDDELSLICEDLRSAFTYAGFDMGAVQNAVESLGRICEQEEAVNSIDFQILLGEHVPEIEVLPKKVKYSGPIFNRKKGKARNNWS